MKVLGKRSAGKPHAAFDVAGAGNGKIEFTAPVLDPTVSPDPLQIYPTPMSIRSHSELKFVKFVIAKLRNVW